MTHKIHSLTIRVGNIGIYSRIRISSPTCTCGHDWIRAWQLPCLPWQVPQQAQEPEQLPCLASASISAQGGHGWPDRCAALHDGIDTFPQTPEIRVPHVSRMYPACIPHVSIHIRYISLWMHLRYMYLIMYLGCIPHVS